MSLTRIFVVAGKEWRTMLRDRLFLALIFIMPSFVMLLFGYGISLDVKHVPFVAIDYDRSELSREYVYRLAASSYFEFRGYLDAEKTAEPLLTSAAIRAVVVIPPKFGRDLRSGKTVAVQTLIDGAFPMRSQTMENYFEAYNVSFTQDLLVASLARSRGLPPQEAARLLEPIELRVRFLYNPAARSIWSIAPGLLMVILMIATPFYTAIGTVREKEGASIVHVYATTVSRMEFLLGKVLPYVLVSCFNAVLLFFLAVAHFKAPFEGNIGMLAAATLLFVICTTGAGLAIAVFVRTQLAAMGIVAVVAVMPAVLYSGILIPISSLGPAASLVAHLLPGMYYLRIIHGVFLKGAGIAILWKEMLVLAVYAAVLFLIGYWRFQKRPAQ